MKTTKRLQATAYHEAGHAVAAYIYGIRIGHVTIEPGENNLGHLKSNHPWVKRDLGTLEYGQITPNVRDRLERFIIMSFAGAAAEQQFTKRHADLSDSDAMALDIALSLSGAQSNEAIAFNHWLEVRCRNLIAGHWPKVEVVAQALLSEGCLTGKRVYELLNQMQGNSVVLPQITFITLPETSA